MFNKSVFKQCSFFKTSEDEINIGGVCVQLKQYLICQIYTICYTKISLTNVTKNDKLSFDVKHKCVMTSPEHYVCMTGMSLYLYADLFPLKNPFDSQ